MRYKISKHIRFSSFEDDGMAQSVRVNHPRRLITNTDNGRRFFINETTETFISKFAVAKSLDEVSHEIALDVDTPAKTVKQIIKPFFRYCRYRHFLVADNDEEKTTNAAPFREAGATINQYKIETIIDVNQNLDVYKAIDSTNGNAVVIKLLKKPNAREAEELKREFLFLKRLRHTSAVPEAHAFVARDDCSYFVQAFAEGLSLPQFVHRKKDASKTRVLKIVEEVVIAFRKIHCAGVVHGDIHPSNIIVTHDITITVLDFGLSIHHHGEQHELVNFGGAYFFMPPERINTTTYKKFTRKPDFYSDVYQLGIVLFTLLYDTYPFTGITWEELATEIKEKEIVFPDDSCYCFKIPQWLQQLIAKCVAKKPTERFTNAHDLYQSLIKSKEENARSIRPTAKV